MNEHNELALKNALVHFIRKNFVLEGEKEAVDEKVIELSVKLYELFASYPHPKRG